MQFNSPDRISVTTRPYSRPHRGFSLVEIMIVVVIIGLMAGLVTYATTGYLEKAKRQRARCSSVVSFPEASVFHSSVIIAVR